jgi:DNA mismatch endonuclease (patch repair protein)
MPDSVSKSERSRIMSHVRSSDTGLERDVRRSLCAMGVRYRLHNDLPGKPDIVIPRYHMALFVDSCFWHGCPEHGRMPSSNRDYWQSKIQRNRQRDQEVRELLDSQGWSVARIWEHDVRKDCTAALLQVFSASERLGDQREKRASSTCRENANSDNGGCRMRIVKLPDWEQARITVDARVWGSNRSSFRGWEVGEWVLMLVGTEGVVCAQVTGPAFISDEIVWEQDLYEHRVPIHVVKKLDGKDGRAAAATVRRILYESYGARYGNVLRNQSAVRDSAADEIVGELKL